MKTSYRIMTKAFFDRTGIVNWLEKRALKGWQLEKIGGFCWKFRRIPAQKHSRHHQPRQNHRQHSDQYC